VLKLETAQSLYRKIIVQPPHKFWMMIQLPHCYQFGWTD